MTFRCNMPKEQSRAALKRALIVTVSVVVFWLAGAVAQTVQSPTIRDVERQLDRHIMTGHEIVDARVARLEIAVATNTEQLWLLRGGGASLGAILIGLNVLNLVGWKINIVRTKGGH